MVLRKWLHRVTTTRLNLRGGERSGNFGSTLQKLSLIKVTEKSEISSSD